MREIDHLYGEVRYLAGCSGAVLRYRLASGVCDTTLHERIKDDVLRRHDPAACDLYVEATYLTASGDEAKGLCAISTDEEHQVTAMRVVA